jgi:hypothetical protein
MLSYILWGVVVFLLAAIIYMTVYLWNADPGDEREGR